MTWQGVRKHAVGVICTAALVMIATSARGEWLFIIAYLLRDVLKQTPSAYDVTFPANSSETETNRLQNLSFFVVSSVLVSFTMFYSLAWGWQWYYYINRRDKAEEWKCQPYKFLSRKDEIHEMILGSANMLFGSVLSGFISCYIVNGGYTTLYYNVSDWGWLYLLLSIPCLFLYIEVVAYYYHRLLHHPVLYRVIHKWHHRYHQPTAFSSTAMHPAEMFFHQFYLIVVPFLLPVHVGVYIPMLLYVYYYGMCDHSGIKMESLWPWQPSTMYHDNHHRLFHVNFGLNTNLMDWLHDTLAKDDRVYRENVFGGFGRPKGVKEK